MGLLPTWRRYSLHHWMPFTERRVLKKCDRAGGPVSPTLLIKQIIKDNQRRFGAVFVETGTCVGQTSMTCPAWRR